MTTYRYDLSLDDSEMIALTDALKMYAEHCEEQLKDGPKSPYCAHQQSLESIKSKLYGNAKQTSGYDPDTHTIFVDI